MGGPLVALAACSMLAATLPARGQEDPWGDVRALEAAQTGAAVPKVAPARTAPTKVAPNRIAPAGMAPVGNDTSGAAAPPSAPAQPRPKKTAPAAARPSLPPAAPDPGAATPATTPAVTPATAPAPAPIVPAPTPAAPAPAPSPATRSVPTPAPPKPRLAAKPQPPQSATSGQPALSPFVAGAWDMLSVPMATVFPPAHAAEAEAPAPEPAGAATDAAHPAPSAESAAPAGPAAPPAPPLYRQVRELQRLQDRMATGSAEALARQGDLIARIDSTFRAADGDAWRDAANARALVTFALSGGGPATLRAVLAKGVAPNIDERLVRGSLAYLEGRETEALKELGEVDAHQLPDSLAGQVALAQAALWVRKDPARASALLGYARLIAPGTLVEEAALRREILVAAQSNDTDTLERLAAAYLARFRHSVYAGNFRQRFAAALTRMGFIDDAAAFGRLDDLLAPLEPESRRDITLMVAQAAVIQGKMTGASLAAARVLASAPAGSLEADRARLYRAAASAASAERYDLASKDLDALAAERLSPEDTRLLGAARAVVASLAHATDSVTLPATAKGETAAQIDAGDDPTGRPPVLAKAQAAIDGADQLLGSKPPGGKSL